MRGEARMTAGAACVPVALLTALWTIQPSISALAADREPHAFVDVTVISMNTADPTPHRTVLVVGAEIVEVGAADEVSVPATATIVDGQGKFLLPGLADMHAHVGFGYQPGQTDPRADLLLYLATGVTTVRNAVGSPEALRLAEAVADGTVPGPRLETASPLLEGEDAVWDFATRVVSADEARAAVRQFAAQGYESIKIYHTLSRDAYEAVADEARQLGVPMFGHVPFDVGVEEVLADGLASIEHFRGYDIDGLSEDVLAKDGGRSAARFASWLNMSDERVTELVQATVAAGTWNCPTFVVNSMLIHADRLDAYADHAMAAYMPEHLVRRFRESGLEALFSPDSREMLRRVRPRMLMFLKRLHLAGAPLMTGTDTFPSLVPGFTLIDEIGAFVEAGLSPYAALQAATTGPARFLGEYDRRGRILPGMAADLVLLGANPLDDIDHLWQLDGVMTDGRWLQRETLLSMLQELAATSAGAP